jgi:hypothetical protein
MPTYSTQPKRILRTRHSLTTGATCGNLEAAPAAAPTIAVPTEVAKRADDALGSLARLLARRHLHAVPRRGFSSLPSAMMLVVAALLVALVLLIVAGRHGH